MQTSSVFIDSHKNKYHFRIRNDIRFEPLNGYTIVNKIKRSANVKLAFTKRQRLKALICTILNDARIANKNVCVCVYI